MKNYSSLRPVVNVALLLSTLALLSACDWFKSKVSCPGCEQPAKESTYGTQAAAPGEALLTLRNKPVITQASFEEYWQDLLKSDPQAEAMLPFVPDARTKVFEHAVTEKLVQEWIGATGKDKDAEYQKKLKKQIELAQRMVALQAFQEDVMKSIDTSEAALEKFYNENKDKNSFFQREPFLVTAKGIKLQAVQFNDEKQAKDFLAKVGKGDIAAAAKAAKKDVKDLGVVSAQSRNADFAVKTKARDMKPGDTAVVTTGNKQFMVLKAGQEQEAKYAPFAEVKEGVQQAKTQIEFGDKLNARLEELKKEFGAVENKDFFAKEQEKRQSEMQSKLKALQEQQQPGGGEEGKAEASAPQAPAPAAAAAA